MPLNFTVISNAEKCTLFYVNAFLVDIDFYRQWSISKVYFVCKSALENQWSVYLYLCMCVCVCVCACVCVYERITAQLAS